MHTLSLSAPVCTLMALSFVSPAPGQEPRGRVVRTEIYNGATRTVRYHAAGLSPGEAQSLRELERLENEADYLRGLDALKREYVAGERMLEPYRRSVQKQLYGVDTTTTAYAGHGGGYVSPGWYGGFAPYPYRGYAAYGVQGDRTTVSRSLATGVGDEGVVKAAVARTIAQQATEEYAASVDRSYERAAARAGASPALRVALGLPAERGPRGDGGIRPAAGEKSSAVTLTLKGGETVSGLKVEEKGNWFVVTLPGGRQLRLRESEVVRIETAPGGVKPASGD